MKFKFEQLLTAARALATTKPVTISEDNCVITITRGITEIDFLRGENQKRDLLMVVKSIPYGKKDTAVVHALDNAGTITTLGVGVVAAEQFTNSPHNHDTVINKKEIINDLAALFARAASKR